MADVSSVYTTDILDHNFQLTEENFRKITTFMKGAGPVIAGLVRNEGEMVGLVNGLTGVAERLVAHAERTDARLKTLENIQLVVKAPKRSKLFLLVAVGGAFYAGVKFAQNEAKKASEEAKMRHEKWRQEAMDRVDSEPEETKSDDTNES